MRKNDVITLSFVALFLVFLIIGINYTGFSINSFEENDSNFQIIISNSSFESGDVILSSNSSVILRYTTNNFSNCSLRDSNFEAMIDSLYLNLFNETIDSSVIYSFQPNTLNGSLDIFNFLDNDLIRSTIMNNLISNLSHQTELKDFFLLSGYDQQDINTIDLGNFFEKVLYNIPHEFELSCVESNNVSNNIKSNFSLMFDFNGLEINRFELEPEFSLVNHFNYSFDSSVLINDIMVFGIVDKLNVSKPEIFDCEISIDNFIICQNISELKPQVYTFDLNLTSRGNRTSHLRFVLSVYKNKNLLLNNSENNIINLNDINLTLNLSLKSNTSTNLSFISKNKTEMSNLNNKLAVKSIIIETDETFNENLEWAIITLNYSESDLPNNINESTLKLYYYNETSNLWELIEDSYVNKTQNYIWANITHFSEYGIFGETDVEEVSRKYYRFEDNECSSIYLYLDELTDDDYDSLDECEEQIVEELNDTFLSEDAGLMSIASQAIEENLEGEISDVLTNQINIGENLISFDETYFLNFNFQQYPLSLVNIDNDKKVVSLFFEDLFLNIDLKLGEVFNLDLNDDSEFDFILNLSEIKNSNEINLIIQNYVNNDLNNLENSEEKEFALFKNANKLLILILDILIGIIFLLTLAVLIKKLRKDGSIFYLKLNLKNWIHKKESEPVAKYEMYEDIDEFKEKVENL